MRSNTKLIELVCILVVAACTPAPIPPPADTPTPAPAASPTPTLTPTLPVVEMPAPYSLVSQDRVFAHLQALTTIQAYSGWRNSATVGEAQGLDYIAETLSNFAYLQELGLELERQSFHVFLGTEIWESRLFLTSQGGEAEVPANALSGHHKNVQQALRFDSDGMLNDADRDPVEAAGRAILLRTRKDLLELGPADAEGKIVFLDFDVIDPLVPGANAGTRLVSTLLQKKIAGLVLVTAGGNGKYAGHGTVFEDSAIVEGIPMLTVRLEDLAPAGIASWDALAEIESARLVWDTDVFSPGQSGNLVARIPGADTSRAIILGAHIDSGNTPGAGDNALNCAVLLEAAQVLDEARVQPPVDVYLAFLGSEELGLLGSQHFVNTHPEILDRALAAFLMDGYTADEPGPTIYVMQEASQVSFGDPRLLFSDYLTQKAESYGIPIEWTLDSEIVSSDDGPFYGFVPAVRFAFGSQEIGHRFHSPYDTVDSLRDQGITIKQSASLALIVALETPLDAPNLRLTPEPERRALILATHTEVLPMTATNLVHLDRALAWEGFDVDVIPYGQSFTARHLADADLVLALPVIDYPSGSDPTQYDEQWRPEEIELLVGYVEQGGFLILTNSANHLDFRGQALDINEDWEDVNALAAPFGIHYGGVPFRTIRAQVSGTHPITGDLTDLVMMPDNGLRLTLQAGMVLAQAQGEPAIVLLEVGEHGGQVLALSDLGLLDLSNPGEGQRDNLDFIRNLARFARSLNP